MGKIKNTLTDIENDYIQRLSQDLSDEIDFDMLGSFLVEAGWYRVELSPFDSRYHAVDIAGWVEENRIGDVRQRGTKFLFQRLEDASLFSLKWLQ